MYRDGIGVARDAATAVAWFRRAAAQGLAPAETNLADAYRIGGGDDAARRAIAEIESGRTAPAAGSGSVAPRGR